MPTQKTGRGAQHGWSLSKLKSEMLKEDSQTGFWGFNVTWRFWMPEMNRRLPAPLCSTAMLLTIQFPSPRSRFRASIELTAFLLGRQGEGPNAPHPPMKRHSAVFEPFACSLHRHTHFRWVVRWIAAPNPKFNSVTTSQEWPLCNHSSSLLFTLLYIKETILN